MLYYIFGILNVITFYKLFKYEQLSRIEYILEKRFASNFDEIIKKEKNKIFFNRDLYSSKIFDNIIWFTHSYKPFEILIKNDFNVNVDINFYGLGNKYNVLNKIIESDGKYDNNTYLNILVDNNYKLDSTKIKNVNIKSKIDRKNAKDIITSFYLPKLVNDKNDFKLFLEDIYCEPDLSKIVYSYI